MKVIIAGGRKVTDYTLVEQAVRESGFEITEEVCGCATGADYLGKIWAERNNVPIKEFPAKWNDISVPGAVVMTSRYGTKYNALAGPMRNEEMAQYSDALIAIWDGKSTGTRDMITRANKHKLKVYVLRV